jgi:hypothetical protein
MRRGRGGKGEDRERLIGKRRWGGVDRAEWREVPLP